MHFTREPPEAVAERVAGALTELATATNNCNIQLLYVIPEYTYNITSKEHTQFVNALHTHLTAANINSILIAAVMTELASKMNISDHEMTLENFTSDGQHLTFETGQHVLTAITSHFNLTYTLPVTTMSNQYFAVQKLIPSGCYKCGSTNHSKHRCTQQNLRCSWCQSVDKHTDKVCPVKLLPCTHCGQFGHYRNNKSDCPQWKDKTQSTSMENLSL